MENVEANDVEENNLIVDLVFQYFYKERWSVGLLVVCALVSNLLQANGVSILTASLIESVEKRQWTLSRRSFTHMCWLLLFLLFALTAYKYLQFSILSYLRQWLRYRILSILLQLNNQNMNQTNFAHIAAPINRVSTVCIMFFSELFTTLFPAAAFLIVLVGYLLYQVPSVGIVVIVGTCLVAAIMASFWTELVRLHDAYEQGHVENEGQMLEVLTNMDKVIVRGQTKYETDQLRDRSKHVASLLMSFVYQESTCTFWMHAVITGVVLLAIYLTLRLFYQKKIDSAMFITVLTLVMLYSDRINTCIVVIPDIIDFISRGKMLLVHFRGFSIHDAEDRYETEGKEFEGEGEQKQEQKEKHQSLLFHQLRFENVSFQYDRGTEPVLQNVSLTIPTDNHQIVGIIGVSGRGKSTLMKLLLRLHACQEGSVYVDDVNVQDIDPDFLRQQIVYVPQSGKLFDRKVKENIFYGCQDVPYCDKHLTYLMQYPKLRELFDGIDFETKDAGALGENLSGGQRQIVNMLSGLVSPAKILVLDEPTNALDPELKQEVLALMDAYRVHKNAILIITHDRDLDGLFDQVVRMDE